MTQLKDVVFDCVNAAQLARFWAAALDDYDVRPYDDAEIQRLAARGLTPETDPAVMVDGPHGSICFQQVTERKAVKNRLHLDLSSADRSGEVQRLLSLGGSVEAEFDDHTVMTDPEGNEFCVYASGEANRDD
jgi:hypothetical protein